MLTFGFHGGENKDLCPGSTRMVAWPAVGIEIMPPPGHAADIHQEMQCGPDPSLSASVYKDIYVHGAQRERSRRRLWFSIGASLGMAHGASASGGGANATCG
jgi:hypothetical protein